MSGGLNREATGRERHREEERSVSKVWSFTYVHINLLNLSLWLFFVSVFIGSSVETKGLLCGG